MGGRDNSSGDGITLVSRRSGAAADAGWQRRATQRGRNPMDETAFWAIFQRCHEAGEMGRKCDLIKTEMIALSKKDAQAFARYFEQATDRAYCWPLWGAAYVINGGCGDDTFSDFRASLISWGRVAFEKALSDPDSLAEEDMDESSWFYEGFQYAVHGDIKANLGFRPARSTPYPDSLSGTA
jgi:hypothetical protein